VLARYECRDVAEEVDRRRLVELVQAEPDPWSRSLPLHLTASALVVHPPSARILLRWHDRLRQWMQVGGHGDAGEDDALLIALREAGEETGLTDLRPYETIPGEGAAPVQVAVVPVPAGDDEAAHEHGDLRYLLVTDRPEQARPERAEADLRWLSFEDALEEVTSANLRVLLVRTGTAFGF
jgi:8-oxo-dGTP pyrophosphatase MutT (NUDIX family)